MVRMEFLYFNREWVPVNEVPGVATEFSGHIVNKSRRTVQFEMFSLVPAPRG